MVLRHLRSVHTSLPLAHLSHPTHSPLPPPSRLAQKKSKPIPFHPYTAQLGSYEFEVSALEPGQPEAVRDLKKKLWLDPYGVSAPCQAAR